MIGKESGACRKVLWAVPTQIVKRIINNIIILVNETVYYYLYIHKDISYSKGCRAPRFFDRMIRIEVTNNFFLTK